MSPVGVRRYRAERLLRREFRALRAEVMAAVQGRLRSAGVVLDGADLEPCYAQAWHGLYGAVLAGEEVTNPAGWLVVVTHRRAIDEQRARVRARKLAEQRGEAEECDLAEDLSARERVRQLLEGLRGELTAREREAAVLCHLHGLTRAEAATQMGISDRAIRKLMDGRGPGEAGVTGKLDAVLQTIREGRWCEQQSSLMRALAYGVLDPRGERYQLALAHSSDCPGCRAYVTSLRGLAAALPPVLLPWSVGARILSGAAASGARAAAGAPAGAGATGAAGATGPAGAAGAAGAGSAAGGGWLLAGGSVGAKLAAGCVLALTLGAGCIELERHHVPRPAHNRRGARVARSTRPGPLAPTAAPTAAPGGAGEQTASSAAAPTPTISPAGKAAREFGPEQATLPAEAAGGHRTGVSRAHAASSGTAGVEGAAGGREPTSPAGPRRSEDAPADTASPSTEAAAQREFAPG